MISLVICNKDPAKFTAVEAMYKVAMGDEPYELIAIKDAKSIAEAYNRAFPRTRGQIVVFSHDDVEILSPNFPQRLSQHMKRFDLLGVAGTDCVVGAKWQAAGPAHMFGQVAHLLNAKTAGKIEGAGKLMITIFGAPRPAVGHICGLDGVFLAARRSVLRRFAFDAVTFDGFHFFDMDMAMQVHHAGLSVGVANDIQLLHYSLGTYDPTWRTYAERFERKWNSRFAAVPQVAKYQIAAVTVDTREEALEIMNPTYWKDELSRHSSLITHNS